MNRVTKLGVLLGATALFAGMAGLKPASADDLHFRIGLGNAVVGYNSNNGYRYTDDWRFRDRDDWHRRDRDDWRFRDRDDRHYRDRDDRRSRDHDDRYRR